MFLKLSLTFLAFLFVWKGTSGEIYFRKGAPHVKLSSGGVLSGKLDFSRDGRPFSSFVGFTYATVPERFAEAKLVTESWEDVKEAVTPGPWCPQQGMFAVTPSEPIAGEEDCLGMNVYVPMNNTGKEYPVMLWIHGGGLMFGDGYDIYGGKYFMDEDVILVTINYRLGVTGFLSTGDSVVPGNNGLKDMVLALQWIQQNIRKFGGNPGKVTVFGESGGGTAAHLLHISPTTKGLIHRAIVQSGTALQPYATHLNPKSTAVKLATHMNCPTAASDPTGISSEEILACLKAAPLAELVKAQNAFESTWPGVSSFSFGAVAENGGPSSSVSPFLTENTYAILANRKDPLSQVPLMIGITEEEGVALVNQILINPENVNELNDKWDEIAPDVFDLEKCVPKDELSTVADKIRKFYFGSDPITKEKKDALIKLYSDQFTNYATYKSTVETATRGKHHPVYLYLYAYMGPSLADAFAPPAEKKTKTRHGDELLYHFSINTPMEIPGSDLKLGEGQTFESGSDHEQFSKNFVKLWTSFAIHGEPKHSWGTSPERKWKPVSKEEVEGKRPLRYYKIEANPGHIDDPYQERIAFWKQLYKEHFEKSLTMTSTHNKKKSEL